MVCVDHSLSHTTDAQDGLEGRLQWYAIYTYPRHERSVAEHLRSHLLMYYLPTVLTESRWKDRTVRLHLPAFSGYVFARITPDQKSRALSATGALRFVSFNGSPATIPSCEIEALRLCLDCGAGIERVPSLEVGDRVRVRSGVLKGLVGCISHSRKERRLIVPITLIHQSVAVEVDLDLLERLD